MSATKQTKLQKQIREKLHQELKKYQENKQEFTDYLKNMCAIDAWLQDGAKNENC